MRDWTSLRSKQHSVVGNCENIHRGHVNGMIKPQRAHARRIQLVVTLSVDLSILRYVISIGFQT